MTATRPGTPTRAARVLGVLGIAGGLGLLLAYVLDIPAAWNTLRLVLFCGGAIAIALATYGRHAASSRPLALAGTVPLVVANGWYIAWILLSLGQQRPFAGDFGMVGFWAGLAFWLADAWFGLVALRLGVVWRWAALVLVAGSLMAIAGMDRLELTSPANPTIFGPVGLAGVALNGLAWVLLGLPIAFPGTAPAARPDVNGADVDEVRYRRAERQLWDSLGVVPAEHHVRLDRLGCTVRIQELGAGPPVLFLHGGSTCGTSWADLAVRLQGFRCLLVDRPGTGLSDQPRDTVRNLDDLARVAGVLLPDILDALELASASIVATSFGGYFALRAALTAPERVRRMVVLGWTAGAQVGRLPPMMRAGTAPVLGELLARAPSGPRTVRSIFRGIGLGRALDEGRISDEAIAAYAALLRYTPTLRNDLALGRLFLSPVRGLDPRIALSTAERARIGAPTLFLWGEADPFGGAEVARSFVEPFPDARLDLLPGAGHAIWMDNPSLAADAVDAFLG